MENFFERLKNEVEWQKLKQKWADVMEQTTVETLLWTDQHRELWTEK